MKTVCKKLLCLMLVAMMLVSAVPFASATLVEPAGVIEIVGGNGGNGGNGGDNNSSDEEEDLTTYTINVGDWSKDEVVGRGVATVSLTDEELEEYMADAEYAAKEFLYGTAYAADANKAGNVRSIYKDTAGKNSTVITIWLFEVSGGNGGNGGNSGNTGNQGGNSNVPTGKLKLTIVYGYTGNRTETVSFGAKYLDVLGTPARPGYNFNGWYSEAKEDFIGRGDKVTEDDTVTAIWEGPLKYSLTFDVNRKGVEQINTLKQVTYGQRIGKLPTPETDDFVFLGWKVNGKMIDEDTIYELQGDATAYAVWALESDKDGRPVIVPGGVIIDGEVQGKGKVYLEIYTNGDTGDLVRRVNITDYADDYKITQAEAEKVAKKYVTAKSGYSLKFEGLFDEDGWWWYCRDRETDGEDYIRVNREGDEYIYIMVKNVKKAVADSSNPKTGDNIMIAVSTMALSAAALVSIVELKKRKMI